MDWTPASERSHWRACLAQATTLTFAPAESFKACSLNCGSEMQLLVQRVIMASFKENIALCTL